MAKGGARKGAGRKKGHKEPQTIIKERTHVEVKMRIAKMADSLISAQTVLAKGMNMLYRIDTVKDENGKKKRKKPKLVTDQWEIEMYLDALVNNELSSVNDSEHYYFLTTKVPSNRALDSLLNRAFGKATESVEVTGKDGKELKPTVIFIPKNADKELE